MKKLILLTLLSLFVTWLPSCAEKGNDEPEPEETPDETKDVIVVTEGPVDLGLSVKWSSKNLGANAWYQAGEHYKASELFKDGLSDICGTKYDPATNSLGEDWRLPTLKQAQELISKCKINKTTYEGQSGFIISGPSGKAIFVPVNTDELWTGTRDVATDNYYFLDLYNNRINKNDSYYDYNYFYARPVYVGK